MAVEALIPPPTAAVGSKRGSLLTGAVGAAPTSAVGAVLGCDGGGCEQAPSTTTAMRARPTPRIFTCSCMRSSEDGSARGLWSRVQCRRVGIDGLLRDALMGKTRQDARAATPTKVFAQWPV